VCTDVVSVVCFCCMHGSDASRWGAMILAVLLWADKMGRETKGAHFCVSTRADLEVLWFRCAAASCSGLQVASARVRDFTVVVSKMLMTGFHNSCCFRADDRIAMECDVDCCPYNFECRMEGYAFRPQLIISCRTPSGPTHTFTLTIRP
jgi:hypothetical protein